MDDILEVSGLYRTVKGRPSVGDVHGLFIKKDGWQGWEGLSAGRREALARAVSHGEFDTPVRLPARVITIDGWVIAPSLTELIDLTNQVAGWGATGIKFPLTAALDHEQQTASVRRILSLPDSGWFRANKHYIRGFESQFVAADPRKYGALKVSPEQGWATSFDVFHDGNFPAHPVIEIPDAPAAYTVSSPAGTLTITGATSGGLHRVDMRTGRVTRNGVWMPNVARGPLWPVPDGAVWTHTLSVPGRALTRDTFV